MALVVFVGAGVLWAAGVVVGPRIFTVVGNGAFSVDPPSPSGKRATEIEAPHSACRPGIVGTTMLSASGPTALIATRMT